MAEVASSIDENCTTPDPVKNVISFIQAKEK